MADPVVIHAVSPDECERADYVVCMRKADLRPIEAVPLPLRGWAEQVYARNQVDTCRGCGEVIVFDPVTVPMQPPRICVPCAAERAGSTVQ